LWCLLAALNGTRCCWQQRGRLPSAGRSEYKKTLLVLFVIAAIAVCA
jgi:hypothetical protein